MNQLIYIEKAKVVMVGKYETGNGKNGPWAKIPVLVEYDHEPVKDYNGKDVTAPFKAAVIFRDEQARWAAQNVKPGNPFDLENPTNDMFLNLWLRPFGDITEFSRADGTKGQDIDNQLVVYGVKVCEV